MVCETELLNLVYYSSLSGSLTYTKTVIWIRATTSKVKVFIDKTNLNVPLEDEHLFAKLLEPQQD